MQGIDTQTQLFRPLLLSCRIRLPCTGKVYTRAQAEPGPTRLLPNHVGLPQTNELGQCTPLCRYRPSSHQEDCCLPHGTHATNNIYARHQLFHHRPAARILKSRKSHSHVARLLCEQQQAAALERHPDRHASLGQHGAGGCRVFAGWIWRGLALLASAQPTGYRGGPCENSDEEMGLSRRRPVGGLRLRGVTGDGPPRLLPPRPY